MENKLIEKGYKEFKSAWNSSKKAFQKKFEDEKGIKYYLNWYLYSLSETVGGRNTEDSWEVDVNFNTGKFYVDIKLFAFADCIYNIEEIEKWVDELFFTMNFKYYETED